MTLFFANGITSLTLPNFFPLSLAPAHRTDFTAEEQKKYERIRAMVVAVGEKVGIAYPERVNFRITKNFSQNACMVGNVVSFSGPVMCLANDYFTHYEDPELLQNSEYKDWRTLLDQIPDHPLEIANWLNLRSPEIRSSICELTKKYESVLNEEEIKGLAAHELGHAKHLHTWKKLCFLLPLSWGAWNVINAAGPIFGMMTYFPVGLLFSLAMSQVSQVFEKEADEETAVAFSYNAGLKSFFKRITIIQLTSESSSESPVNKVRNMVEGFDFRSHPHPAKRVIAALERKERPATPISILEKGLAFVGGALLIHEVAGIAGSIYNKLFGKKKE